MPGVSASVGIAGGFLPGGLTNGGVGGGAPSGKFNILQNGGTTQAGADNGAALATLIASLNAVSFATIYFPAGTYAILRNVVVPGNIALEFAGGAVLNVAAGKTVTINGPIVAALAQVFSGAGNVMFGAGKVGAVYPEWFGALGNNTGNDAPAINAANAAAAQGPGLVVLTPGAVYATAQGVVFTTGVMAAGAAINYTGPGVAVQVGDGVNIIADQEFHLPRVLQVAKTGLGWGVFGGVDISASVGVKLVGLYECTAYIPWVGNFAIGLLEYGITNGSAYNKLFLGHLHNNQVNNKLDGDNPTGWVNENIHFGGRMSHDSNELQAPNTTLSGQPGVRHVQIKNLVSTVNNHRWRDTSLEGDVPEYLVDVSGQTNLFDFCRYEAQHPKVRIIDATSTDNEFRGGIYLDSVAWTFANGAVGGNTKVTTSSKLEWSPGGAGSTGSHVLGNGFDSTKPVFTLLDAGINPHNYGGNDWGVQLGARSLVGKAPADAPGAPRLSVDFTTGNIATLGDVTATAYHTAKGSVAAASATFVTILTPARAGRYLVAWSIVPFGGGPQFTGTADLVFDGAGSAYLVASTLGASVACQMSGANFQIKQSSGAAQTLSWTCLLIPF